MTLTFKTFMEDAQIEKSVEAMAKHLLGSDDVEAVEAVPTDMAHGAKRLGHKFVDTMEGPWALTLRGIDGHKYVQADPPHALAHEHRKRFFVLKDKVNEAATLHNVIGRIYDSRHFHYDAPTKTFSNEISNTREVLKRLWNDSADQGFGIRSAKTGSVELFTLHKEYKDNEGDVTHWEFHVINPHNDPKLRGMTVKVFND